MLYFEEIRLNTWQETKQFFDNLLTDNQKWVFRGHYKASWKLQPSLERIVSRQPLVIETEAKIITEFQRRAHQYLQSSEIPSSLLEWISLMQHHGAPTRLLDWTRSPYVASFIAFENAYKERGEIAIWVLDAYWLINASLDKIKKTNIELNIKQIQNDSEFIRFIYSDSRVVIPIEPKLMNERLTIQQGIFLIASGKKLSFEKNIMEYVEYESHSHIKKIIVPKSEGVPCLTELNRMNINAATLFPGLDGFARSLRTIPDITYANFCGENDIF
ncbi:MAG: FRG domain-containing protein [Leptospiraceae bacterium]|nr:FRG domain-containing protein [Leptospiraceae bacterium]MCP5494510.1 FRG domain-containing protein [Leptospiraceae bacterium]